VSTGTWAAVLSAVSAISVLVAGFFQWWDVGYNGQLRTRGWVRVLFVCLIVLNLVILVLAVQSG
jgi:hypothetical protein